MKRITALLLSTALMVSTLTGCGAKDTGTASNEPAPPAAEAEAEAPADAADAAEEAAAERMSINVAGISGGMQSFPVWVAEKKGWFDEENIDVNITYFENGPVQVEAISSWDVAATGIGGILGGAIAYDAQVIAAPNSDDGTQMIYARPDHPIVTSGQGHNALNPEIYGDAEAWKGATVLCSAGTVLQYLLIKTLEGVGLTVDDVNFMAMDTPTTNSAFLSGEGDAAVLTGVVSFAEDKKDYVLVSSGPLAEAGLDCCVIASEEAVTEKKAEIKAFLKAYLKAVEWIDANKEEAVDDLMTYCDESGKTTEREVAEIFIQAENFYGLEDNYRMFNEKAEGSDSCLMESRIMKVLEFFIEAGNYSEGDDERFAGHVSNEFINAIYEEQ